MNQLKKVVAENKNQIAAIIVEPFAGNMGMIRGTDEFLNGLRKICNEENMVLIFDEVMTGFRVAKGGATGNCKHKT